MGLIKKKTAIRGTEGGVKYVCDVCSADITATVSALPDLDPELLPSLDFQLPKHPPARADILSP
jgi:hypothetical protein